MYELILPLGIVNFLLVLILILSGLKIVKISYKAHRYLGITLGILAFIHGAIAFYFT
jgi:hypothetical protein